VSASVETAAKLRFLADPASYERERPQAVECIETHMSWVFLTDHYAYKLKKPERWPYLDLSSIAAREQLCRTELRLNRRLAEDVYLEVVALVRRADGRLELGGEGRIVDWLLQMKRLPRAQMLDQRLAHDPPGVDELARVIRHLVRFFRKSPPAARDAPTHLAILARELALDLAALSRPVEGIEDRLVGRVIGGLLDNLPVLGDRLEERVRAGRLIDAHGDLRPEHVFLGEPPAVIDCLEFSDELRVRDTADEMAFLALECERLGRPAIGEAVLALYERESGDRPGPLLYGFYRALRAAQRARLAIWHAADPGQRPVRFWLDRARDYLRLAESYLIIVEGSRPERYGARPRAL
jgi:aminoglycoside phosphotransferase family enzyme